MKEKINLKKYLVCIAVLLSIFLFPVQEGFSESSPSTILLGEFQHFDLESPAIIPFASTGETLNEMKQNECNKVIILFFNTNKPIEITPTLNGVLLTHQEVTIGGTNPLAGEFDLVTRNPQTMQKLDPQMDEFGIFFRFDTATGNAVFDAMFEINCDSASTSGSTLSNSTIIAFAISSERNAKNSLNLEYLVGKVSFFSVSMAIDDLTSAVEDLQELKNRLENSNVMIGMSSIQSKLTDAINIDTEAIDLLEQVRNTEPSASNGEFTSIITRVRRLITEAIRYKERIESKLNRAEKK